VQLATFLLKTNAVLDQIDDALLCRSRHGGSQNSLADNAAHLGLRIYDREHVAAHHIVNIRRALLDGDDCFARIFSANDKGPRVHSASALDNYFARMDALCATVKDEFDADNVGRANLDHSVFLNCIQETFFLHKTEFSFDINAGLICEHAVFINHGSIYMV
jgi:hypothetical protein